MTTCERAARATRTSKIGDALELHTIACNLRLVEVYGKPGSCAPAARDAEARLDNLVASRCSPVAWDSVVDAIDELAGRAVV